jgi:hypothetical protein
MGNNQMSIEKRENNLELIFTQLVTRRLSKDFQFQFIRAVYQIQTDRPSYALRGRQVTVCGRENGTIVVFLNQVPLDLTRFIRQPKRNGFATPKDIESRTVKPAPDHLWRQYGNKINGMLVHISH